MLIDFKACKIGHADFKIKFIDTFVIKMSLKLHLLSRDDFVIIYTLLRSTSHNKLHAYIFQIILPLKRSALHSFIHK